jgi:hypothetical protein
VLGVRGALSLVRTIE